MFSSLPQKAIDWKIREIEIQFTGESKPKIDEQIIRKHVTII